MNRREFLKWSGLVAFASAGLPVADELLSRPATEPAIDLGEMVDGQLWYDRVELVTQGLEILPPPTSSEQTYRFAAGALAFQFRGRFTGHHANGEGREKLQFQRLSDVSAWRREDNAKS